MNKLLGLTIALALGGCVQQQVAIEAPPAPMAAPPSAAPASPAMALPTDPNPLFWPREVRALAFQNLDQMPQMAASRTIAAGGAVHPLPAGAPLDMGDFDLDAFMEAQGTAAIVVVLDGEVVLERYGLGFGPTGRWTSFSVAKSLNSTLVGAALLDGAIESLSDPVSRYIPDLAGSAYDDVTVRQLLTMTSGCLLYTSPSPRD